MADESVARPPANQKAPDALEKEGDDAAVIMLCNQILANGIAKGASTVHVEVVDKQVLVHYRIQGQLMIVRKIAQNVDACADGAFSQNGQSGPAGQAFTSGRASQSKDVRQRFQLEADGCSSHRRR